MGRTRDPPPPARRAEPPTRSGRKPDACVRYAGPRRTCTPAPTVLLYHGLHRLPTPGAARRLRGRQDWRTRPL